MPIETGGIITLVAGSSVLAALLTHGVAALRESRKTIKDASFSALYLAIALEYYADNCSAALSDSENYEASEGHAGLPHSSVPDLPDYPLSIEWKPLGIKHTTEAMSFRVEVETAKAMIGGHWEFLEEDDVVPLVREETARLGDKALELAIGFRKTWNIAAVDYSGDWSVKSHLSGRVEAYRKAKADREEHNQKMHDELASNVKDNSADVRET